MTKSHRLLAFGSLAIVAALIGAVLSRAFMSGLNAPSALATGTLLPTPRDLPALQLQRGDGSAFSLNELKGQWSVLFFGFTNCPDICPTTLTTLAQVDKSLADVPAERRPRIVFVSVDPQRDTPAVVERYVKFFNPRFLGVTGTQQQIEALTRAVGVPVIINRDANGGYTVDHAANLLLLNRNGQMAGVFSPPFEVNALSADLRRLAE